MNKLYLLLAFAGGAVVGALSANKMLKEKYAKLADEEINQFKKEWKENYRPYWENECQASPCRKNEFEEDIGNTDISYDQYSKMASEYKTETEIEAEVPLGVPYVVTPEEFGDIEEYKIESLVYFKDEKLSDSEGNLIDINTVGKNSLTRFGEYEPDCVYVRNDFLETDFEILLDDRNYSEVWSDKYN